MGDISLFQLIPKSNLHTPTHCPPSAQKQQNITTPWFLSNYKKIIQWFIQPFQTSYYPTCFHLSPFCVTPPVIPCAYPVGLPSTNGCLKATKGAKLLTKAEAEVAHGNGQRWSPGGGGFWGGWQVSWLVVSNILLFSSLWRENFHFD